MSPHGRLAQGVPRWAAWAAGATAFVVVPSGIWRILDAVVHVPLSEHAGPPPEHHGPVLFTGWWYPVLLTLAGEGLAYLTVGLVATWGEVWPRWMPWLGGRRVPIAAAVIPAGSGAVVLTALWTWSLIMLSRNRMISGSGQPGLHLHGWQTVVFTAAYLPLIAWGPLLGAVTIHYYRRRTRTPRPATKQAVSA
jgi:hypothetical protein